MIIMIPLQQRTGEGEKTNKNFQFNNHCLSVAIRYLVDEHSVKKEDIWSNLLQALNMCNFGTLFAF